MPHTPQDTAFVDSVFVWHPHASQAQRAEEGAGSSFMFPSRLLFVRQNNLCRCPGSAPTLHVLWCVGLSTGAAILSCSFCQHEQLLPYVRTYAFRYVRFPVLVLTCQHVTLPRAPALLHGSRSIIFNLFPSISPHSTFNQAALL